MKVLVAGDFAPCRGRVADALKREDYSSLFGEVQEVTGQADWSIVNFECPVVSRNANPIKKNGHNISCSNHGVAAIKYAGFDCVTLANNHFFDFGLVGVEDTINSLIEYGIDYVGGGTDLAQASKVYYKDIANQRLAIINCCEHEFSIATTTTAGCNPLNPVRQYQAIQEARNRADRVLVIVHGGHEHFQLPSPRMVETYRFFVEAGADAVVNHHQHCYSGYEVYMGKPIFYGLGNFCFDKPSVRSGKWTEGYAVTIDFSRETPSFMLHPYAQCGDMPKVRFLPSDSFDKPLKQLNAVISNPEKLEEEVNLYYAKCTSGYDYSFDPINNRFYHRIKRSGLIPSLVDKEKYLLYENHILCESHRDKLSWWLSQKH